MRYQHGFKSGESTSSNITYALLKLHGPKHLREKMMLLFDLKKAFDMVNRDVLFEILRKRCINERDHHLVSLIEILYRHSVLRIGDHAVQTNKGVPQGGVISPYLFNIYLEEALLKLPTWKRMIEL